MPKLLKAACSPLRPAIAPMKGERTPHLGDAGVHGIGPQHLVLGGGGGVVGVPALNQGGVVQVAILRQGLRLGCGWEGAVGWGRFLKVCSNRGVSGGTGHAEAMMKWD